MSSPLFRHGRVLLFGILCGFTSGVGQTFFISLFVPGCEERFNLDKAAFSSIYAACTIASAFLLPVVGTRIDRISALTFFWQACALLVLGGAACAFSPNLGLFAVGLFLLRFAGQGLCSHTWNTSVSRFFTHARGRALGIASLGHPLSESLMPFATVALVSATSPSMGFVAVSTLALFFSMPVSAFLLARYNTLPQHFKMPDNNEKDAVKASQSSGDSKEDALHFRSWNRREVFTDFRVWLMMPSWFGPGFFLTGMFFHQLTLAEEMKWSPVYLSGSFFAFGLARALTSFFGGFLTDALGARVMVCVQGIPLAIALCLFAFSSSLWVAPAYLALAGAGIGLGSSARTTFLADRFGTLHLGAIRSTAMPLGVLGTAVAPPIFGAMLDDKVPFSSIAVVSSLCMVILIVLSIVAVIMLGERGDPKPKGG